MVIPQWKHQAFVFGNTDNSVRKIKASSYMNLCVRTRGAVHVMYPLKLSETGIFYWFFFPGNNNYSISPFPQEHPGHSLGIMWQVELRWVPLLHQLGSRRRLWNRPVKLKHGSHHVPLCKWHIPRYIPGNTVMKHEKTDPNDQTTTKVDTMDPN